MDVRDVSHRAMDNQRRRGEAAPLLGQIQAQVDTHALAEAIIRELVPALSRAMGDAVAESVSRIKVQPRVTVTAPAQPQTDFGPLLAEVRALARRAVEDRPGLDTDALSAAVAKAMPELRPVEIPPWPTEMGLNPATVEVLREMRSGPVGGGNSGHVRNKQDQRINPATEDTLADLKRGVSDFEARFDYGARTDSQPVFIGKALQGTATGDAGWTVEQFSYDGDDRVERIQVASGTWDGRSGLF